MKKVIADIYSFFFKFTNSYIVSLILAVLIVSVLDYFCLNGTILISEGVLPIRPLEILFTPKIKYLTFIGLVALNFYLTYEFVLIQKRKPDYIQLVIFFLISILLIAYINVAKILD